MLETQNILRPVSTNNQVDTSTANMDIVKEYLPVGLAPEAQMFRTLTFLPKAACTLIINKTDKVRITPELGINMDDRFRYMHSIEIVEAGIDFYFLASY